MEEWFVHLIKSLPIYAILIIAVLSILTLGKGADMLVDEAVALSLKWGVPKILIGATIVSLGTTLPEASVSVLAAMSGNPDIALGNAVGSIICDTGLILGITILISPPKIDRELVNKQGMLQFGAGILLVASTLPYTRITTVFEQGGSLPQGMGLIFLLLLGIYLYTSIKWAKKGNTQTGTSASDSSVDSIDSEDVNSPQWLVYLKLFFGIVLVIASSKVLIPSVEEIALRFAIPQSIISATLVAFGTSLPELVTAITAARKGHGELALGNIIGADILNVLFVAGAAASVTPGGLLADESFFIFFFPAMLFVLIVFRISVVFSKEKIGRPFGFLLLGAYVLVTVLSYFQKMT
jgi:cation:H+ antiporter